jgi:PrtD family type I secretion system ABC transporter
MRWLFVNPLRPFVLLAGGASLLLNAAMLVPSLYMLQVFDRVFASRSLPTLAMLSLMAVLALAFAWWMDVARARALAAAGDAIQRLLSPPVLEQSLRASAATADGTSLRLADVGRLSSFLGSSGVRALFDAPWLPLYLCVITLMHPLLGVAAGAGALLLAVLALVTEAATRMRTEDVTRQSRDVAHEAERLVRHGETINSMGMAADAVGAWSERNDLLHDARRRLDERTARLGALARVARQGVQLAVLATGAWLVLEANASPGIMIAATVLLGRALQPVEQLIAGWKSLVDARAAWRRLAAVDAVDANAPQLVLPAPAGRLELERVTFAAEAGRPPQLRNVSFSLAAGQSLGLVGASGAGKTTLLRLILGTRAPQGGTVRLDGADVAQWDRNALGTHVGWLPQDVSLLAGTVAQNVARLGAIDDAAVVAAAKLAGAHEMILRLPNGYETRVGENGCRLSGGQAQRIAFARALYGGPQLVVLDEPDAHLDAEGQDALKAALAALKARGTTVVVAGHRAGVMAQLDRIAVLADGMLQAFGPAAEVLARASAGNVRQLTASQREAA